ncbi:unnamed protein product, partial [Ectocarpus sp. 6 AP-2014]
HISETKSTKRNRSEVQVRSIAARPTRRPLVSRFLEPTEGAKIYAGPRHNRPLSLAGAIGTGHGTQHDPCCGSIETGNGPAATGHASARVASEGGIVS